MFAAINGNSEFRALKMALKYLLDKQYKTDVSELHGFLVVKHVKKIE